MYHINHLCLSRRIINDFINRLPNLDNKKDMRDLQVGFAALADVLREARHCGGNGCVSALQEVTQRVLEAVGGIAGSSLEQTSWLSRSLEVKVQPQICEEADEADEADVDGDHDGNFTSSHLKSKSHLHLLHSSVTQSLMLIRSCYFINVLMRF